MCVLRPPYRERRAIVPYAGITLRSSSNDVFSGLDGARGRSTDHSQSARVRRARPRRVACGVGRRRSSVGSFGEIDSIGGVLWRVSIPSAESFGEYRFHRQGPLESIDSIGGVLSSRSIHRRGPFESIDSSVGSFRIDRFIGGVLSNRSIHRWVPFESIDSSVGSFRVDRFIGGVLWRVSIPSVGSFRVDRFIGGVLSSRSIHRWGPFKSIDSSVHTVRV